MDAGAGDEPSRDALSGRPAGLRKWVGRALCEHVCDILEPTTHGLHLLLWRGTGERDPPRGDGGRLLALVLRDRSVYVSQTIYLLRAVNVS